MVLCNYPYIMLFGYKLLTVLMGHFGDGANANCKLDILHLVRISNRIVEGEGEFH